MMISPLPTPIRNTPLLGMLWTLFTLVPACSSSHTEDRCERLFAREKHCSGTFLAPRPAFLDQCRTRDATVLDADFACLEKSTCEAFLTCQRKGPRSMLQRIVGTRLKELISIKDFAAATALCTQYGTRLSAPQKGLCTDALALEFTAYQEAVRKVRDTGSAYEKECDTLLKFTGKHMKGKLKEARETCLEAQFSRFRALGEARILKYQKQKRTYLPAHCRIKYLKQFEKIPNAYVKKGFDQLLASCYKRLGLDILSRMVPKMSKTCTVGHLLPGYTRYKIAGPHLDPLLKRARALCTPKR